MTAQKQKMALRMSEKKKIFEYFVVGVEGALVKRFLFGAEELQQLLSLGGKKHP